MYVAWDPICGILCVLFYSLQFAQENNKTYAAIFAPFWNEIIKSLREEDFISNRYQISMTLFF